VVIADAGDDDDGVEARRDRGDALSSVEAAVADGAEILDGDRTGSGLPDGTERSDDAVIIDGGADDGRADDGRADDGDGGEMVFGGDVRDPDSDVA
jgi:hypothetical protein